MPQLISPRTQTPYYLVAFDKDGSERQEEDGFMSEAILSSIADRPPSDIFIFSHGWSNDVSRAILGYSTWIDLMASQAAKLDVARASTNWSPLLIGIHWPSLPWGREELPSADHPIALKRLVGAYAFRTADTAVAREAIGTIIEAARRDPLPPQLPRDVFDAALQLQHEALPAPEEIGAAPGADREPMDPDRIYERLHIEAFDRPKGKITFGGVRRSLLDFIGLTSFWTMKGRARTVGERGCHSLLRRLQNGTNDMARIHLMGHSFGCIVASAMVAGASVGDDPARPVHSMVLVQGALSCWAYSPTLPGMPERTGYFRPVITRSLVAGPMLSLFSTHDSAVRVFYRWGAGLLNQVDFMGKADKYDALGRFGMQEVGALACDLSRGGGLTSRDDRAGRNRPLGLETGTRYNINAAQVIRHKEGAAGAHNDIVHDEVAGVIWDAALTGC